MKKVIIILGMLFIINSTLVASDSAVSKFTDISAWQTVRIKSPQKAPILWFNHEHVKFFVEARLNFDWSSTIGLIGGKTFSKNTKFWITPKAGFLVGASKDAYNGPTIEANFGGVKKNFNYFTMTQLAFSVQKKNPFFFYHFFSLQYNVHKNFALCAAGQIYQEMTRSTKPSIDIGPQAVIMVKGFYLKIWYTGDPISRLQKVTFGLGYGF